MAHAMIVCPDGFFLSQCRCHAVQKDITTAECPPGHDHSPERKVVQWTFDGLTSWRRDGTADGNR